ncbi:MAG TPA: hypothetical protein PKA64_06350 [Myxococcota bacterium]|nr:hypothetical protein [Myxococcota bacterium]
MPKTDRTPKTPVFLDTARAFYAQAFEHRRKKDLAAAMEEWADLDEPEQSFAVAHLLFLNLKAQADTLRVLVDLRDLLDEVADGVDQALDVDDDDEPEDDDRDEAPDEDDEPAPPDSVPGGVRVDDDLPTTVVPPAPTPTEGE